MVDTKIVGANQIQKGSFILMSGVACKVVDVEISKPGKHGHSKVRISAVGLVDEKKRIEVMPGHDNVEVPVIQKRSAQIAKRLEAFREIPIAGDIRQAGMMIGIELVKDRKRKTPFDLKKQIGVEVIRRARNKGAILRPLGSVVVLVPILAMNESEIDKLFDITYESIKESS